MVEYLRKKSFLRNYQPPWAARDVMPTWAEALISFRDHLNELALAPGSVTGYVGDLRSLVSWLVSADEHQMGPDEFTLDHLMGYREHLLETRGLSPATINRRLQSVRKFCAFAVQAGIRDTDPTTGMGLLRRPTGWGPRTLAAEEIARLDWAAGGRSQRTAVRDRAILHLLLQTGMRAVELVVLRPADLELEAGQAVLTIAGATVRPSRRLALGDIARDSLLAYLEQARPDEASHLFLNRDGEALSVRTIQQIVAGLGKAAGVGLTTGTLRDTYARMLWQQTGDLGLVAERMGYQRPETAVKHIMPLGVAGPTTEDLAQRPALHT